MHITPKRRRRAMRVHYLTQRSGTQKDIAAQLNVSKATVRADLQLVETHWSSIASAAADDLLLESLHLLQIRLSLAIKNDDVANQISRLTSVEFLRARDAQENQLNTLAREIRRTAQEVQRRAAQRPDQPELYEEDAQDLAEPAETTPESAQIDPPISRSPVQSRKSRRISPKQKNPRRPRSRRPGRGSRPALPPPQRQVPRPDRPVPRPDHQPRDQRLGVSSRNLRRSRRLTLAPSLSNEVAPAKAGAARPLSRLERSAGWVRSPLPEGEG